MRSVRIPVPWSRCAHAWTGSAALRGSESATIAFIVLNLVAILLSGTELGRYAGLLGERPRAVTAGSGGLASRDRAMLTGSDWQTARWDTDQLTGASPSPWSSAGVGGPLVPAVFAPAPRRGLWVPILLYHYIRSSPDRAGVRLSVLPADFQAQMRYLKNHGYNTITIRELDLALTGQRSLPPRPVALTFDDGYQDFFTTAAPLMRSLGMTATSYIPTMLVGRPNYMTWPEVQLLDSQGFEMAAHSQFHANVAQVSWGRAEVEIFGAKADLERHLGHPVVDWAYPYGGFNAASIALVRQAGYLSGATTRPGGWHDSAQMALLTRIRVAGGEPLDQFVKGLMPY